MESTKSGVPHPNWKPGDKIENPVKEMVQLDFDQIDPISRYKLLIGSVVPRPIAFISTLSAEGVGNLAPFSFFNGVSSNPACISVAITAKSDGSVKDTWRNIQATGQFVVNTVSEWMVEPMNYCSAEFPYGVDEMQKAGLTPLPSVRVKPPRVAESPVQLECELYGSLQIGDGGAGSSTLIVGKILVAHVHKPAYDHGRVLIEEIKPIARLGGANYARTAGIFELARPKI